MPNEFLRFPDTYNRFSSRYQVKPRQARLDAPGTLHHVIIRGIERSKIVSDDRDRQDFVSRMGNIALETATLIYAWALMTNHAHILLRSGPSGLPQYRDLGSGHGNQL